MQVFRWTTLGLKMFGVTLLRTKLRKGKLVLSLFGIPVWRKKTALSQLVADISENESFDVRDIDKRIEKLAYEIRELSPKNGTSSRVAYIASKLYDIGGHSKCVRDLIALLAEDYDQALFLTRCSTSKAKRLRIVGEIAEQAEIGGTEINPLRWKKDVARVFEQIRSYAPKALFVFIHPDDVYGAMLLSLLKRNTDIGILYCPHASHYPNVGMSFSDLSLEGMPSTAWITREKRKFPKTHLVGMVSKKRENFPCFTEAQITKKRSELGLIPGSVCTMSGGAHYKFFDSPDSSEYFQTVKRILEMRPQVKHVILSDFSADQKAWIEELFKGSDARARLVLLPQTPDYELVFSCADLFFDSFSVSSALTMIDLMRLQIPTVVKINTENVLWSFHEYQRPDYPYMFEDTDTFVQGAIRLIDDGDARRRIARENYLYYLEKYEGGQFKQHLCELIENYKHLEQYIDTDPAAFNSRHRGTEQ